ncbi:MAG: divergent polysaccharide deacetylase family protein [Sporomusaceae bacterium]|nr:divergent polysaccharide deacetylase family protein [Sporomusaceae bacterium]
MARRKKSRRWPLLLALLAAVLAVVFWPASEDQRPAPQPYKLDKTGAGSSADYSAACYDLHQAVDAALAQQRVTVRQKQEFVRQVPRKGVEGELRWHARQLLIEKPASVSTDALLQALKTVVAPYRGSILGVEDDAFAGQKARRVDIGLQEPLEQDTVTIIADQIFILEPPRTQAKAKAKLAIIIDDFGYSAEHIAAFTAIKQPLTFSVLPYHPYSNMAAANALAAKHQVMLHMPMEPLQMNGAGEPVMLSAAMSDAEIKTAVTRAIASIPGVSGLNNHQGSKATADARVMQAVMTALKPASLFFIDSRTSAASVAAATARKAGVRTAANDLFIDNVADPETIKQQLRQAIQLSLRHGSLIVIGHDRPATATALTAMLPEFEAAGVQLVFASQLVE